MAFCSFAREYKSHKFTDIENKFILQFLPEADGKAVKVYLYGLFLCQNTDYDMSMEEVSASLKIEPEELLDNFLYWEDFGLVNILSRSPLSVEYLPLDSSYKNKRISSHKYSTFVKELQLLISERMITPNEYNEYFNLLDNYSIAPEAMILIIKYCVDMKGKKINYRYITTVIKNYAERNITTYEQIEKELSDYVLGGDMLNRIYSVLKINKKPEIDDQIMLKKWLEEYSYNIEDIIFSASKIKNGGMKKLNSVIEELYINKRFDKKEIDSFIKDKEKIKDFAYSIINMFQRDSVSIEPYMTNYFSPWLSKGYDEQGLTFIAKYCFKKGKRSIEDMNGIIENLYQKGIIDFKSVAEYFELLASEDKFIKEYFEIIGVSRKPNSWDRENLQNWRKWNFSNEMIIEAAKRSAHISNPIPYMNAILSRWKNENIYNIEQIKDIGYNKIQPNKGVHFANERTYSKEDMDKLIDSIDDLN